VVERGTILSSVVSKTGSKPKGDYNVLFIAVDDLRPQLRCYGYEQMVTPNLDRLAESGTLFMRAYCQQAVCAPSRASLLSGCRPDTTRIYDLQTPLRDKLPSVVTLPQLFREHGYHTVSLGKVYHHGYKDDPLAWSETPWEPPNAFPGYALEENLEIMERYWEARRQGRRIKRGPSVECADLPDEAYPDGKLAEEAVQRLRALKDKKFFLAVGFYKPHLAFACPKRYWDLYPPESIKLPDNMYKPKGAPDIAMHNWGELRQYAGIPDRGELSEEQAKELIRGYYACVSFLDAQVGKLLDELERLGLWEETVIILWGDNGWNLGEHGLWCKHSNFETSVWCPLTVRAPGQKAPGGKTKALVEFVDIYPSLCDICGLPKPDHLEGLSFAPLLDDPDLPWKKAAFSQYPRGKVMGYTMRTDRYRYTEWIDGESGEVVARELYDHEADPGENVNVAELPENRELVERLSRMLRAGWRAALP